MVSREQPAQSLNLVETLLSDIPDSKELDQWTRSSLVDRAFRRIAWVPMSLKLDSMGMSEVCRAFSSDVQKAVEALNDTG